MITRIAEAMTATVVCLNAADGEVEALKTMMDDKALEYLRGRFPNCDEKVFHTDHTGRISEHVVDALSVCKAIAIEQICADCNGTCSQTAEGKPVVKIETSPKGFDYLSVGWAELKCKYKAQRESEVNLNRLFPHSGLTAKQRACTFASYNTETDELKLARHKAIEAMQNGTNLILAGKWGTGKTHLAIAIALNAMGTGKQAFFRASSAMANELRESNFTGRHYELLRQFSEVPCLVVDDLGKDRSTDAWCDYLYGILDYRYTHDLQTIITTNALSIEELASWWRAEYIQPMISRLLERGAWVTIKNANDYRLRRGK